MTLQHVTELLAAAAGVAAPPSCVGAARRCLEAALTHSGAVAIFVDGVDEVCPFFKDKVLKALELLEGAKKMCLWVSSRPEVQVSLQEVLCCSSAYLQPLARDLQMQYLCRFWASAHQDLKLRASDFESVANELIQAIAESSAADSAEHCLLQVPLHAQMAAEAFQAEALAALRGGTTLLRGGKVFLLELFQRFIERKRDLYMERHGLKEANFENININETFDEMHQQVAVFLLVSDGSLAGLEAQELEACITKYAALLSRERTGIMWMEDAGVRFLHYSFAEFFAAAWLLQHGARSPAARSAVRQVLGRAPDARLRHFLQLMLAEGRPLHGALLAGDESAVDALLLQGCQPRGNDALLGWTPLQYVDALLQTHKMAEYLRVAERLLQAGADPKELVSIGDVCTLLFAVSLDIPLVMKRLMDSVDESSFVESLHVVIKECSPECLARLLDAGSKYIPRCLNFPPAGQEIHRGASELYQPSIYTYKGSTLQNAEKDTLLNKQGNTNEVFDPIHTAILRGDQNILTTLITYGAKIDVKDTKGNTPLHIAVMGGESEMVETLLRNSAYIQEGEYGYTPLHLTAIRGAVEVGMLLLRAGAETVARNASKNTPLHVAAMNGHGEFVKLLLDGGVHPDVEGWNRFTALHFAAQEGFVDVGEILLRARATKAARGADDDTPLHIAAANGQGEFVKLLLDNDVNKDDSGRDGFTALHFAAEKGFVEVGKILLRAGATKAARNAYKDTPLHIAAVNCQEDFVKLLLDSGVNPDDAGRNGFTALRIAAEKGYVKVGELLLHAGAEKAARNAYKDTPLHFAAANGQGAFVKLLLDSGMNKDESGRDGFTALHFAAEKGFVEVGEILLRAGAKKTERDANKDAPLHIAALNGQGLFVKLLLDNGVKPDDKGWNGCTALHRAASKGFVKVGEVLLRGGALMAERNADQHTPLHRAALNGQGEFVKVLLDSGVDPNDEGWNGFTALHYAADKGFVEVGEILLRAGAKKTAENGMKQTPLDIAVFQNRGKFVQLLNG